jgi:drug/metabolite transporter (DMT)-like permease
VTAARSPGSPVVGYALVATAAAAWGTWPLVLRTAERIAPMPAALESTILMAVIALVTAPLALVDRVRRRATPLEWLSVAWLGVSDAMNALFFFKAYQRTSVAIAVLSHYLAPLLVALAAPLVLGERLTRRTAAAVLVGFAGLVLLLRPWDAAAGRTDAAALGALFGATSAFFYASNVLVNKRLFGAFSGSELMFYHSFTAVPTLVALVPRAAWAQLDLRARAVEIVALGSVGPGAFAGLLFVWGLRRVQANHAATLTLLEPLVAMLLGLVVYGERIGPTGILGGALILAGAAAVVSRRA